MIRRNHTLPVATPAMLIACMLACILAGHASGQPAPAALKITSSSFQAGQPIPAEYTCEGADISPALRWSGVPASAKTIALICEDPDAPAGIWTHWVLYNLPAGIMELAEKTPTTPSLPPDARQGTNDFKRTGYSGPCPPAGKPHRYFFKIYALDIAVTLNPGANRQELLHAMEGHVVAAGQITGTYRRKE